MVQYHKKTKKKQPPAPPLNELSAEKRRPLAPAALPLPPLQGVGDRVRRVTQQAGNEADGVVLEGQDSGGGHEHDGPALGSLLVRDGPVPLPTATSTTTVSYTPATPFALALPNGSLPQVAGAVVEALADAGELEAGGDDHDAEEGAGEGAQKVEERLAEESADEDLEGAEEDDAGAAARAKAVLRGEPPGAVAHGHGAEPAAREVHGRDAEPERRHRWRRQPRQQVRCQRARRHHRVQRRQRQLRHAHSHGVGRPGRQRGARAPEPEAGEVVIALARQQDGEDGEQDADEEDDQGVGETRQPLGGDEGEEGCEGPEAVVKGAAEDPGQRAQERGTRRDDQRQAGAELDALDDGHGDHARGPA